MSLPIEMTEGADGIYRQASPVADGWKASRESQRAKLTNVLEPYERRGVRAAELLLTQAGERRIDELKGFLYKLAESKVDPIVFSSTRSGEDYGPQQLREQRIYLEAEKKASLLAEREAKVDQLVEEYLHQPGLLENSNVRPALIEIIAPDTKGRRELIQGFTYDLVSYNVGLAWMGQIKQDSERPQLPEYVLPGESKMMFIRGLGGDLEQIYQAFTEGWNSVKSDLEDSSATQLNP